MEAKMKTYKSRIPEKLFFVKFSDSLRNMKLDTKQSEDGTSTILDITTHNTDMVINALKEAAMDAGYVSLAVLLTCCKTDGD
jgi:hypothetical protein